jgi:hypothetical protein
MDSQYAGIIYSSWRSASFIRIHFAKRQLMPFTCSDNKDDEIYARVIFGTLILDPDSKRQ